MIIKKWDKDLKLDRDILLFIPLWIRLSNILIRLVELQVSWGDQLRWITSQQPKSILVMQEF